MIINTTRNQREKISKLLLLYASEAEEVNELPFGSVGVILGLKHTRTGDTLASPFGTSFPSSNSPLRNIVPPPAVVSASIIPRSHSDLAPVEEALQSLVRTDPSVRVETQDGQLLVHGLGALHLEIVEGRLRDEWDARFEFGRRRVSYREGLCPGSLEVTADTWQTEVAGKSVTVMIALSIRPIVEGENGDPTWNGNIVVDQDDKALVFPELQSDQPSMLGYIARGLASTLSSSPHTSLALSRIHIRVDSFQYPEGVPPSVLTGAAAIILRSRIRNAGMGPVMEPYVRVKISVNEDSVGKVIKDLTEHGGEVLDLGSGSTVGGDGVEDYGGYPEGGVYIPPDWLSPSSASLYGMKSAASSPQLKRSIHAVAPLSKMLDYSNRLRAFSAGHGLFEMTNAGFREVAEGRKLEILREIGRVNHS
jgi:elongation factor G